jgi:hypothetical protein
MERTIREHIENLERRLNLLNTRIMEESDVGRRNHLESEMRAVEMALEHFRAALEIEKSIKV